MRRGDLASRVLLVVWQAGQACSPEAAARRLADALTRIAHHSPSVLPAAAAWRRLVVRAQGEAEPVGQVGRKSRERS